LSDIQAFSRPGTRPPNRRRLTSHPPAGPRVLSGWGQDALVAGLSVLMIGGITLDFRAHAGGIGAAEEGLVTPEHAFFCSTFLAIAGVVGARTYRRRRQGRSWAEAVPAGYGWGVRWGRPVRPRRRRGLPLARRVRLRGRRPGARQSEPRDARLGAGLFLGSPLRAARHRLGEFRGWRVLPVLVSASLVLTIIVPFGSPVDPLAQLGYVAAEPGVRTYALGWTALVVFPLLFVATGVLLARRFDLAPGGADAQLRRAGAGERDGRQCAPVRVAGGHGRASGRRGRTVRAPPGLPRGSPCGRPPSSFLRCS